MRGIWPVILLGAVSAWSARAADKKEYKEADAGCVVYSVGTTAAGMGFGFSYHRIAMVSDVAVRDWKGTIEPKLGGAIHLKIKDPDFIGSETGHVMVRCLPPGLYQVDDFSFGGSIPGIASFAWSPGRPFLLPFNIRSGQATYIGSFMRSPSLGTPLQPTLKAAGFFIIADRSFRDLPIALLKLPGGMKIVREVTDVSAFRNPALRTAAP